MESIEIINAKKLTKHQIDFIKSIVKSRPMEERGFDSYKLDMRHLSSRRFCVLGPDWYLYYKISFHKIIEVELLETKKENTRLGERTVELLATLKEMLRAYPEYVFCASINAKSKVLYDLATRSGFIEEISFKTEEGGLFHRVTFRPSPLFIEQNKEKEKRLDFKRI